MAEPKHTPGPWEAWQEGGQGGPWHVHTAEGHLYIGYLPNGDPDEANARLIAAAPELFDALLNLRWTGLTPETTAAAEAALGKALGPPDA